MNTGKSNNSNTGNTNSAGKNLEIEVKIEIDSVPSIRRQILAMGFRVMQERFFEYNIIYDTPGKELKKKKFLFRLRKEGDRNILTFKRPVHKSSDSEEYKIREEIEVAVSDFETMATIIDGLGYQAVFIYEKYRELFCKGNIHLVIDETPIGNYIEIEGTAEEIDGTARELGYDKSAYIVDNYRTLFKQKKGKGDMRF